MRRIKNLVVALLGAMVALCIAAAPALAEPDYTYTVRIFTGNNGTINGETVYTLPTQYHYGDEVRLDRGIVQLNEGVKYYVKGFRLSGADAMHPEAFTITEDTDFVVAYGVSGDMVSFTVHFVEYGTNKPVNSDRGTSSVTYYGKVGDKPNVPYEYVPGYRPRYRSITGTLGAEGTNEWTLEYVPVTQATVAATPTTPTNPTVRTNPTPTSGGAGTSTDGTANTTDGAGDGADGTDGESGDASTTDGATNASNGATNAPATEEVLDVDELKRTPSTGEKSEGEQDPTPARASNRRGFLSGPLPMISVGVLAAATLLIVFLGRRTYGYDEDNDAEE